MIFASASRSFGNLFSPPARWLLIKSVGLAILLLVAAWLLLHQLFVVTLWPVMEGWMAGWPDWLGWLSVLLAFLSNAGIAVGLVLLMAPVTSLVAGLFLDDIAQSIETTDYPADRPGTPLALGASLLGSVRFALVVLAANIVALILYFIPGINIAAFFLVNGYLIGREYFEFVAMRHMPVEDARAFRARHQGKVMLAGCLAALLLAIPFANLLTPIFAAGLMVHLFKALQAKG